MSEQSEQINPDSARMTLGVEIRYRAAITLAAAVLLLAMTTIPGKTASNQTIDLKLGQSNYRVELATTPEQRARGLMHRNHLPIDQGMLLVYPRSGDHRIWMKNMFIPLRVIWIDDNFRVVSVQRLVPCSTSPCPVYAAPVPARYVLELSDDEHDIELGDRVEGLDSW